MLRLLRDPGLPLGGFDPAASIVNVRYPYTQRTNSIAAFGQGDLALTDTRTATLGLRYSRDRIAFDYRNFFEEPDFPVTNIDFQQTKTFKDLSFRTALTCKADDRLACISLPRAITSMSARRR